MVIPSMYLRRTLRTSCPKPLISSRLRAEAPSCEKPLIPSRARERALPRAGHAHQRPLVASSASSLGSSGRSETSVIDAQRSMSPSKDGFHIHFGAGKLGLGLVFKGLVGSGVPFSILNPPFEGDTDALLGDKSAEVVVNGESILPGGLTVVTKDSFPGMKEAMMKDRSILLTFEGEEWDELIPKATSFSCSIGPKVCDIIGPVLERNCAKVPVELRPRLFACENDHEAVQSLKELLKGRVEVIPCMVDRICSEREVVPGSFNVTTEPWQGTIVPLTPIPEEELEAGPPLPLGGSNVLIPTTERESDYMYDRKIMTVNHMHTTLGFLTLVRYMEEMGASPAEMVEGESACKSLPLVSWKESPNPRSDIIWCWAVAQCLLLISEHDRASMMKSHGVKTDEELNSDLLGQVRENLARFSQVEDSTARVLGAGVDKRYQGRLLPAYEAVLVLQDVMQRWPDDNRYQLLLDMAGVSIGDVVSSCEYLVRAAEPIAEADREKYKLEKGAAEPFYLHILDTIKSAAGAVAEVEKTAEEWLSDEIEWIETNVKDPGLEWVQCQLESLGFRNVIDWQASVESSYGKASANDEEGDEKSGMNRHWMVSMEEKQRRREQY